MEKTFYFFRHGETNYNLRYLRQGCQINKGLNSTGRKQAQHLAENLLDKKIELIYSSPLYRAVETAGIIADKLQIPVIMMPQLTEGNFGEAEGLHEDEVKSRWPEIISVWYQDTEMDKGFPGGETKQQIQDRMFAAINNLLQAPADVIGISSHGTALRLLLMKLGCNNKKLSNAEAIEVQYHNGEWTIY